MCNIHSTFPTINKPKELHTGNENNKYVLDIQQVAG